ncbi:MAG: nucleotidyltransferase family protein [Candidatus Omnitrophica bacterium]|nr:nucleotidyltransferase family protein [Candidatus Omnitrophota bacterium]
MNESSMLKIPQEFRLIFLCARLELDASRQEELGHLSALALDWGKIKKIADKQKLTPLVYANLNKTGLFNSVPQEVRESIKQVYLANLQRNLVLEKEIFRILELASAKNIRIILLKGLALIYTLYNDHALRIMVDADMFIKREDFLPLKNIFLQLNYQTNEKEAQNYDQQNQYELMFSKKAFKEQCIFVDLHWKLLPSRPYLLDLPLVWERVQKISISGREFFSLSSEDNFLYLTLHLRRHVRDLILNSVVDIAELLKTKEKMLDWDYIKDNARKNHFFSSVYFVLYLCRETLDLQLSEELLDKFRVNATKKFLLRIFVNKTNFFTLKRWKGAIVRFLLFDNLLDFFLYLWKVSFCERGLGGIFTKNE